MRSTDAAAANVPTICLRPHYFFIIIRHQHQIYRQYWQKQKHNTGYQNRKKILYINLFSFWTAFLLFVVPIKHQKRIMTRNNNYNLTIIIISVVKTERSILNLHHLYVCSKFFFIFTVKMLMHVDDVFLQRILIRF